MKCYVVAAAGILLATSVSASEMISGTNTYVTEQRTWPAADFAGYYMYDSDGVFEVHSGPLPDMPVECHGAGFWTSKEIQGEGICIFGEAPNRWTVAFTMAPGNKFDAQNAEGYRRRGDWKVVHGTGEFVGMTGAGIFVTGPVVDGRKTTQFEGEVEFAK